ncbi:hypothetical protein KTR66_20910 [Roseococcus sp. SDR]|uniref:hypothetical protein n=1 Tax=Roseococcus sp. SDR TaxID=2835532 RepID=UPI001BD0144D|nr:hypothetical protein [Roseococcus sp. SDR]MBS7792466.1 hypothetical protein [Roseococcus sp. SDR]MBV1847780.1 hypothetical protein [Roseococcus sp. SDR]
MKDYPTRLTDTNVMVVMAVVQPFAVELEKFSIFFSWDAVKGTLISLGGIRVAT